MRVLHLTTHLNPGGITHYIFSLIEPLRGHGDELFVVSSGGTNQSMLESKGATVFDLPIRTKSELHPKIYLAIPRIVEIIKKNKIDVLHAHTRITQIMAFWISQFVHIPVVTTCHGFYKKRLGRMIWPAWGDQAIAISEPVGDSLGFLFRVPMKKIQYIPNGVDLPGIDAILNRADSAEWHQKWGLPDNSIVIGCVARLVPDKGHHYLLEAFAQLKSHRDRCYVLIVGDGKCRHQLEEEARKYNIEDRVIFTGNLPNDKVIEAINAMHIFVLPATWREGFGLSIAEAMATRTPVVFTNICSLNTLIENGMTGIMVEPKNSEQLADTIEMLINDQAMYKRLAENGRHLVEQKFTLARMASQIHDVYQELHDQFSRV